MSSYESAHWVDFALGQLGASAALAGLVFVSLSINVRDVMQSPLLVKRAAEAVVLLGSVLATSTAVLIPGQAQGALAAELMVLGAGMLLFIGRLQTGAGADSAASRVTVAIRRVSGVGGPALLVIAGVSLAVGAGGGLYWWPAAVLLAYIGALGGAWVLLIEILR